jgi:hypothetical protein
MSDDRTVGGLAVDDKVLITIRRPEPSSHPDARMDALPTCLAVWVPSVAGRHG